MSPLITAEKARARVIFQILIKRLAAHLTLLASVLGLTLFQVRPAVAGGPVFEAGQEAYFAGDIATAIQLWRPLAEHGDAEAQFALGTLYYGGIGVAVDYVESSYWFLRAAEQGLAPAQYNLGNAYQRGEGLRRNPTRAVQWWQKAADQGLAAAQYNLANAYHNGEGVARDRERARQLYRKAADNGYYPARQVLEKFDLPAPAPLMPDAPAPHTGPAQGPATCRDWLQSRDPRSWTLQLMASEQPGEAETILRQHGLQPAVVCKDLRQGKPRYVLLFGDFADKTAAQQAAADLPRALRANRPWLRRVRAVQKQFKAVPSRSHD
ncbi:MAG TPA: hypothetical protein ENJ79_01185 [Gammaproteobacteria bacterium]|nr:hypothetical protein [Gammaproteobacteria bacterium]